MPAERRPTFHVTSLGLFAGAFLLLCGSVAAVVAGQVMASKLGPMLSLGYSAGAVVLAIAAMVTGGRR